MPKTAVQTPICDICGADVRAGSLFCYNCGGSLKQTASDVVQLPPVQPAVPPSKNGVRKAAPADTREARQPRKVDRGPVEVVWEPREGLSWIYVTAGVVLLVIAIVLFVTAILLK
jgi:hypothetical protein